MIRRVLIIALAACLVSLGLACRQTTRERQASKRKRPKLESLIDSYNPRKTKELVQAKKGEGEGAKVKVYLGPSSKQLVIGELNFGTLVERLREYRGWWAIRYYNADGGTFYGWIRIDQAQYIGTADKRNEVIVVVDERKKNLSIQESDDELMAILAVPYKVYQKDADSRPKKLFWSGPEPDGHDGITLLSQIQQTSETVAWARERQRMISELASRAHKDYRYVLKAYYDAIQWYVMGEKPRFTQMIKAAEDKRNEISRHFSPY